MKKFNPTISNYSYMVTSLLTAWIEKHGTLSDEVIEQAVEKTKYAFDLIGETIFNYFDTIDDDNMPENEVIDYFDEYPWDNKPARYTDLANWLVQRGVTSKRRIQSIFHECLESGVLKHDKITKKYVHSPLLP